MSIEVQHIKKIFVVSLLGKQRVKCLAAFNGEVLVIQKMETIGGLFSLWHKPLAKECQEYADKNFLVLIEERTSDHFAQYGQRVLFDEVDPELGRTYQNIALDEYFALTAMGDSGGSRIGNLVLQRGLERHQFGGSMINVTQDEKGRNQYDIEPDRFTGHHRALLLAVLGAQTFNPVDDDYLKRFYAAVGDIIALPQHETTMNAVIQHRLNNGFWMEK